MLCITVQETNALHYCTGNKTIKFLQISLEKQPEYDTNFKYGELLCPYGRGRKMLAP